MRSRLDAALEAVLKPALFLLCLLPLASIVWRTFGLAGTSLGVNPIETIQDTFGRWALRILIVTLAVSPLRLWLGMLLAHPAAPHARTLRLLLRAAPLHELARPRQEPVWTAIADDLWRPFIVVGLVAFALLIPLAITSTDGMMRRLGGRWKKLHRLSYVVPLLGVWHYWWQVKADVRDPLIYLAILSVLLGWRWWRSRVRRKVTVP